MTRGQRGLLVVLAKLRWYGLAGWLMGIWMEEEAWKRFDVPGEER